MNKIIKALSLLLALSLAVIPLAGCDGGGANISKEPSVSGESVESTAVITDVAQSDSQMFSERDLDDSYDEESAVHIELLGDSARASSDSVLISGTTVTITEEATYVITGALSDGTIAVNAADTAKIQIVLDGVTIESDSAPLYILEADKVFLTLAQDSENTLSGGDAFEQIDENNIDGVIFSKGDLTINGGGSLTVSSPACHGIVCKDDLCITGGSITITSASHGIDANDSVRIAEGASLKIDAGKDAVHAENSDDASLGFVYVSGGTTVIEAEGDGISAGAYMHVTGGSFDLLCGGGSENAAKETSDAWGGFMGGMGRPNGMGGTLTSSEDTSSEDSTSVKGLKSGGDMLILGGSFKINSADDSVHSDASITVGGGSFVIASGDDGFHADDTLTVISGTIDISQSYEGLEALHITVSGGDIRLTASDDGLNAAGGVDASGFGGDRGGDTFGGRGGMGGMGGPAGMGRPDGMGDMGGMNGGSSGSGSVVISGGELYVRASGDGIDANGTVEISGGYTVVCGPTQGDTATLDYDTSAVITGGTFIGSGASGMAQTFSDGSQGVIALSTGRCSAGTSVSVEDESGAEIISCAPALDFEVIILSTPELVSGRTYTARIGSESGKFEAD